MIRSNVPGSSMKVFLRLAVAVVLTAAAHASTLPGFRVQKLGPVAGGEFLSSLVVDSRGAIYYTTTPGNIYRFTAHGSTRLAHVDTVGVGAPRLLGMARRAR